MRRRVLRAAALFGCLAAILAHGTAWALEVQVRSENMTIDQATGRIRFEGKVQVQAEGGRIDCGALTLLPEKGQSNAIRQGLAEGGVIVTRDGDTLTADRLEFDITSGHAELSGDPALSRGGSRVTATRIRYNLRDGSAVFTGPVEAVIYAPEERQP